MRPDIYFARGYTLLVTPVRSNLAVSPTPLFSIIHYNEVVSDKYKAIEVFASPFVTIV